MQIGLESDPLQYVAQLVAVFDMVREILQPDGTLWLNLGDSYASGGMSEPSEKTTLGGGRERGGQTLVRTIPKGTKAKDLLGIPWMVAFALRNNGWYLRSDVIWHKPNPMPESVTDRPTKSHEYVFLLAKSGRYYYDQEAIAEQVAYSTVQRLTQPNLPDQIGSDRIPGKTNGNMKAVGGLETRNRRSVWTIATQPFDGAHFATFPQALIEPCILAGARPGDTVLDPFMGSGTTGQVATNLGRNFVGCELNPKYVDLHEMRSTTIGMPW
jgi:site-specific DNA-methyltransferase (cytosine-N4-specific)